MLTAAALHPLAAATHVDTKPDVAGQSRPGAWSGLGQPGAWGSLRCDLALDRSLRRATWPEAEPAWFRHLGGDRHRDPAEAARDPNPNPYPNQAATGIEIQPKLHEAALAARRAFGAINGASNPNPTPTPTLTLTLTLTLT